MLFFFLAFLMFFSLASAGNLSPYGVVSGIKKKMLTAAHVRNQKRTVKSSMNPSLRHGLDYKKKNPI